MPRSRLRSCCSTLLAIAIPIAVAVAPRTQQPPPEPPRGERPPGGDDFQPGFGPPGPPGMAAEKRQLVARFDRDGDGRLNREERSAARAAPATERRARRGPGRPGGFGTDVEPPSPGPAVQPADVSSHAEAPLYEPMVLRTLFLQFEAEDWEAELAAFYGTDVDVPADLTVDGRRYPGVGVHFRGASSYFAVGAGSKRSLNLSLDFLDGKQRLYGHRTLNLLNAHEDPSFLRTVLFLHIARQYIPAPKANFVRVVINGESWGVYVSAQQFNRDLLAENFADAKGTRWKVKGSPRGAGGLDYIGEDVAAYKARYSMLGDDDPAAWQALITLCRTLSEADLDQLEAALTPMLDLDSVLWFLALDVALINNDGYWIRASDYSLFRDRKGVFHLLPHDANETLQAAGGPGGPRMRGPGERGPRGGRGGRSGGVRGGGVELDPLVGMDEPRKPLRSRLLAVPSLRTRYLDHVRVLAEQWLDWNRLGPLVEQYHRLLAPEIAADTRKLTSTAAFEAAVTATPAAGADSGGVLPLRAFADQRRRFLLTHPAIQDQAK